MIYRNRDNKQSIFKDLIRKIFLLQLEKEKGKTWLDSYKSF